MAIICKRDGMGSMLCIILIFYLYVLENQRLSFTIVNQQLFSFICSKKSTINKNAKMAISSATSGTIALNEGFRKCHCGNRAGIRILESDKNSSNLRIFCEDTNCPDHCLWNPKM